MCTIRVLRVSSSSFVVVAVVAVVVLECEPLLVPESIVFGNECDFPLETLRRRARLPTRLARWSMGT